MASATDPLPYKLIAGEPCLDFVNTVSGRVSSGPAADGHDWADRILEERLGTYEAFVRWAEAAGLIDPARGARLRASAGASPRAAGRRLGRARALREALYRIFKASLEGWSPPAADVERLNHESALLLGAETLSWNGARMERSWRGDDDLAYPLWLLVRSAEALLTSGPLERVRQCPGDRCGWLFLDTSRGGRRRWCTMADCGNVAKVRRFRGRARRDRE